MSEFAIRTQRLCKHYGRKRVLHNLSLDLPRGGIHALVGSNGAGKSTLFRLLLGVRNHRVQTTNNNRQNKS